MLLRQMKYFTAVVDCNSFTEAAEQCFISQSAISQQIRALEKELGVQLLRREHRRFSLTPTGQYFYTQSKAVLSQIEHMTQETRRLGGDEALQLCIGYLRCYGGLEFQQAVEAFSALYPEVNISIVKGTHEELYDLLRSGSADVILSDQRRAFSQAYYNIELLRCACCAELSVKHPLSRQTAVSVDELKGTPCILIAAGAQQEIERAYYHNTLGFGDACLFAEDLEAGRLLAVSGRGFLPVDCVGTLPPPAASVKRLPVLQGGKPLLRSYCAFWRKERTNYYIEEFAAILHRLLADSAP